MPLFPEFKERFSLHDLNPRQAACEDLFPVAEESASSYLKRTYAPLAKANLGTLGTPFAR